MEHLRNIYDQLKKKSFTSCTIKDKSKADIELIYFDTMRIAAIFFDTNGYLKADDLKAIGELYIELKRIVPKLDKWDRQILASLRQLAERVFEIAKSRTVSEEEIDLRYKWKKVYEPIKIILNELDVLWVADMVDDEYDDMNFKVYTQLLISNDENEMFEMIRSFVISDYCCVLPGDAKLMKAVKQLVLIKA